MFNEGTLIENRTFELYKVEGDQMIFQFETSSWGDILRFVRERESALKTRHTKTAADNWSFGQPLYFHIGNEIYCGKERKQFDKA